MTIRTLKCGPVPQLGRHFANLWAFATGRMRNLVIGVIAWGLKMWNSFRLAPAIRMLPFLCRHHAAFGKASLYHRGYATVPRPVRRVIKNR